MAHAYVDAVRVAVPKVEGQADHHGQTETKPKENFSGSWCSQKHPTNCAVTDIPLVYRAAPGAGRVKEAAGQG